MEPSTLAFYRDVMQELERAHIRFLVGGAFALNHHAGITRDTKDLDLFLAPSDVERALSAVQARGFRSELTDDVWLAKAFDAKGRYVDLIFNSGNGIGPVDEEWFLYAEQSRVLGVDVWVCPAEEMIFSKSFIMERERYDGADVAHLLLTRCHRMDWDRLLRRYGEHWRVLLAHLVLFGFVYPEKAALLPPALLTTLTERLVAREDGGHPSLCRGSLLSRKEYQIDTESWGFVKPPAPRSLAGELKERSAS